LGNLTIIPMRNIFFSMPEMETNNREYNRNENTLVYGNPHQHISGVLLLQKGAKKIDEV